MSPRRRRSGPARAPEICHDDGAGALLGATTAVFFPRDEASVGAGASVLVNGASGAVGTNAVQVATYLGATVTGVTSTANLGLVTQLVASHVIDHTQHDPLDTPERFDVVLNTVGNLPFAGARRLLRANGVLLLAVASLGDTLRARGNVVAGAASEGAEDVRFRLQLVTGRSLTVVHDDAYELDDIASAHERVDSGRKIGNIIVRP